MKNYEDSTKKRYTCIRYWPQWIAAIEISLVIFIDGLVNGWTSGYIQKLTNETAEFHTTEEQASWIASMVSFCHVLGDITGTICLEYLGCKMMLYLSGFLHMLGWLCFLYKNSVIAIYAGRFLNGTAAGIVIYSYPLFMGEIADPKIRSRLINFIVVNLLIGMTIGNIMSKYLDMHMFALISLIPNVIFLCSFVFLPHSPYYLIKKNRIQEAAKSIEWYRRDVNVKKELEILEKFISNHESRSFLSALRDLNTPVNRKTFIMIVIVSFGTVFSGFCTVSPYLQVILTKSGVTIIEPSTVLIFASIVGIIGMFISIYTSDKFERKYLFALSCGIIAVMFSIWGCYFLVLELGFSNPHLQWIPLICALLDKFAITQGIVAIVPTLRSELFAPNVKGIACGISSPLHNLLIFFATKSYQPLVAAITEKYVFFLHAFMMVLAFFYGIIYLPDTKGKSLPEIQEILTKKFSPRKNNMAYNPVQTSTSQNEDTIR